MKAPRESTKPTCWHETGFKFEGGPYEGTYDAWVDRAFRAERALEEELGDEMRQRKDQETINEAALLVASRWPHLTPTAFIEQVRSRFYPRPDENVVCGEMWAMFASRELELTSERGVIKPRGAK